MKQNSLLVVGDADALVALIYGQDSNHQRARNVAEHLAQAKATIIFPITAYIEAVTVLQHKLKSKQAGAQAIKLFMDGQIITEAVDQSVLKEAAKYFHPEGSKRNTLFDAVVYVIARQHHAAAIFSFDRWYKKQGFTLAEDLA